MSKNACTNECGKRLKKCLQECGMTQVELSEKSNFVPQYISQIITGKRNMSLQAAEKFSNILHVSRDYLLGKTNYVNDIQETCLELDTISSAIKLICKLIHLLGITINSVTYSDKTTKYIKTIDDPELVIAFTSFNSKYNTPVPVNCEITISNNTLSVDYGRIYEIIDHLLDTCFIYIGAHRNGFIAGKKYWSDLFYKDLDFYSALQKNLLNNTTQV